MTARFLRSPSPTALLATPIGSANCSKPGCDAGYAVIAPRFPYSAGDTPNITTESALADMANQPDDVRAAVDDVLGDAASKDSPLFELIQARKSWYWQACPWVAAPY